MLDTRATARLAVPRTALDEIPTRIAATFTSPPIRRRMMLVFAQILAGTKQTFVAYLVKQMACENLTLDETVGFLRLCISCGVHVAPPTDWSTVTGTKRQMPTADSIHAALNILMQPAVTHAGENVHNHELARVAGFVLWYGVLGDPVKLDKHWSARARFAAVLAARAQGITLN